MTLHESGRDGFLIAFTKQKLTVDKTNNPSLTKELLQLSFERILRLLIPNRKLLTVRSEKTTFSSKGSSILLLVLEVTLICPSTEAKYRKLNRMK
jgi:hypothetical protein